MYNIIFLGDRRIAQEAIQLINSLGQGKIRIKALVSSYNFFKGCKLAGIDIPVFLDNSKNDEQRILEIIASENIDMLISIQHNWILTNKLLESVNFRALNLHNAKLPNYKGYNSISHSIINGDKKYYTTIHWMVSKVDSGDIAYEREIYIEPDETALTLYEKSVYAALENFKLLLHDLLVDNELPKIKIIGDGVFYKKDSLNTIKNVTDLPSEFVERIVRGVFFPPYEPAYIIQNNNKIYLLPTSYLEVNWKNIKPINNCNWAIKKLK